MPRLHPLPLRIPSSPRSQQALPAEWLRSALAPQSQAVGLLPLLVGAVGDDGLPPALRTGLVLAGAEEQPVAVCAGHPVKEKAQGFAAPAPVAVLGGRDFFVAGGDVGRAQLLAVVVQVAGFGRVQAGVTPGGGRGVGPCWGRRRVTEGGGDELGQVPGQPFSN